MDIQELPIGKVVPNKYNPNRMTKKTFATLKRFIEKVGFIQPVLVRPIEGGMYEIMDGQHRYEAMKELGRETIPVVISVADEDVAKLHTINMNNLRGTELDRIKLGKMVKELRTKMDDETLEALLGFNQQELKTYEELVDFDFDSLQDESEKINAAEAKIASDKTDKDTLEEFSIPVTPVESDLIRTAIKTKPKTPDNIAIVSLCNEYLLS